MSYVQKSSKFQQTANNASVTIPAPVQGHYNCLEWLDVMSDAVCVLTIKDGAGTTLWSVPIAAGGGYEKRWFEKDPFRGTEASALVIAVSGGNYSINVGGYVHP